LRLRHTLRTPLHHIIGFSEMIQEEAADRGDAAPVHLLTKATAAARHLLEAIEEALPAESAGPPPAMAGLRLQVTTAAGTMLALVDAFARQSGEAYAADLAKVRSACQELREFMGLGGSPVPAGSGAALQPLPVKHGMFAARILVVDDDETNREILVRQLDREGFRAETAADGPSALSRLGSERFDLVLLDLFMPGMDGFEVLARLKRDESLGELPVIVLSALNDVDNAVRSIEMGAEDFLAKPFDPVLLRARIGAIVRRREAETERAKLAGSLELLLESAGEAVYGIDRGGCCTFINRAALSTLGYEREQLMGRLLHSIIHHTRQDGTPYPVEDCPVTHVLETGEPRRDTGEMLVRADGSRFPVEYSAHPILREGTVDGVVVTFEDISERRREEEQLLQSAKLESLGVLAGGVAHDFNNILTGILGNASLALESMERDNPNYELLQEVVNASERAADLTRQMLAFAGKGSFIVERVNLSAAVEDIRGLLESSLPKGVRLLLQLGPELPAVEADLRQVQQAIINLVINAGEAMEERSGAVAVETGARWMADEEPAQAPFEAMEPGRYVYAAVQDTGVGMDAETRARIFEPFFSTKFTGRGLGLAAALGIARSHRGAIRVASEAGRGSRFELLLPAAEQGPKSRGILVVDDEEIIRRTTRTVLERRGFEVFLAEDGREAVELFRRHQAQIALVVLDLTMPAMDGEETARYLHTIRHDVPILVSSGYNESDVERRFAGSRVAGFVRKPYTPAQLMQKIEAALGKRHPDTEPRP
jgi:PAS domain S-box-containing protein